MEVNGKFTGNICFSESQLEKLIVIIKINANQMNMWYLTQKSSNVLWLKSLV